MLWVRSRFSWLYETRLSGLVSTNRWSFPFLAIKDIILFLVSGVLSRVITTTPQVIYCTMFVKVKIFSQSSMIFAWRKFIFHEVFYGFFFWICGRQTSTRNDGLENKNCLNGSNGAQWVSPLSTDRGILISQLDLNGGDFKGWIDSHGTSHSLATGLLAKLKPFRPLLLNLGNVLQSSDGFVLIHLSLLSVDSACFLNNV